MDTNSNFQHLIEIMAELREKCPWDRKQTIGSLRQMTLEETYELTDAITAEDWKGIKEELGDLLLHIAFYSKIAEEQAQFNINDVITTITEKLIRRHPHIYPPENGETLVLEDSEAVKKNWEKIKKSEGKKSVLSGLPVSLPAVIKAMRLQEKAKQVGFEWENKEQVWQKVEEEMHELQEAVSTGNTTEMEGELGDVLFSLVNYARFLNVDAENALELTNKKFIYRFQMMEKWAADNNNDLNNMTLDEMDAIWNSIKKSNNS